MLDILYEYIQQWSVDRHIATAVTLFTDALELYREFQCDSKPQMLFMDIGFRDASGFDVAKMIRDKNKALVLVFATGTAQYAVDGYSIDAYRYLLKPIAYETLAEVLDAAYHKINTRDLNKIALQTSSGLISIDPDEISFIESVSHYIIVHLISGEQYKCKLTIRDLEQKFRGSNMVQCHRAFLVNLLHIYLIQSDAILLKNGERVPLSRSLRKTVQTKLLSKAKESF